MKPAAAKTTVGDFSVLPITIPPLPAYPKTVVHHVYVRRNSPKVPTEDHARSLFLSNVPVDSTEAHFRALISSLVGAGRFEGITLEGGRRAASAGASALPAQAARLAAHSKKRKRDDDVAERDGEEAAAQLPATWSRDLHRSGSTAVALLADEKSVDLVLKAIARLHKTQKYPVWGEGVSSSDVAPLGSKWLLAHNALTYPSRTALQDSVDAFFVLYNRREQEAAELAKRLRNEPDEDGFVTVTRGGGARSNPARAHEAEEARRRLAEREARKREGLTNFYRFQLRERQKEEQAALLERFEEDRRKVSAMREKRGKFRPEA